MDVPDWRIVSEELWERVQERIRFVGARFSSRHMGGFTRTERSKRYIFSGFLICGICGSKMVIVTGSGKRAYVKYGCPSHRYRGTCSNGLMIRQDGLEAQLIAGLTERISKPEMIEYALKRFQEQLQERLRELQEETLKAADSVTAFQSRCRELKGQPVIWERPLPRWDIPRPSYNNWPRSNRKLDGSTNNSPWRISPSIWHFHSNRFGTSFRKRCWTCARHSIWNRQRRGRFWRTISRSWS